MRGELLSSVTIQRREEAHPVVTRKDFVESYDLN